MSGHSHWATIRRAKASADAKKGRVFSKYAKLIMSAARIGGGDPDSNIRLRYAIEEARAVNMPRDNIQRAILKGTGELGGQSLEVVIYEGYGHGGVAILVETLTDNRNRTAPEIRRIFENNGGSLAGPGSVAWMFEAKGIIAVPKSAITEDELLQLVIDAGADDLRTYEDLYEIICAPALFNAVRKALADRNITPANAQITNVAKQNITPSLTDARRVLRLMEELEDHDDVQNVSVNFDIPAELVEEMK